MGSQDRFGFIKDEELDVLGVPGVWVADRDRGLEEPAGCEFIGVIVGFVDLGVVENKADCAGCALECG